MRPSIAELLTGINKTIMINAMPIVQQSGDMEALWELATGTRLMSYIEDRWKSEFGRLAGENAAMEEILKEAAAALDHLNHPLAGELADLLKRSHCEIKDLPAIDDLAKANADLKGGLDQFIIAHSKMKHAGSHELSEVRQKVRGFLKEINDRDFEAAQSILFL
jgi:hypothetical protein